VHNYVQLTFVTKFFVSDTIALSFMQMNVPALADHLQLRTSSGDLLKNAADDSIPPKTTLALSVMMMLHFMIGFLTCLNDILVPHLKAVFALNYTRTMLIQFTFFTAYFVVSLPAGRIIAAVGYKRAMQIGLIVSASGALVFYPAAAMAQYWMFLAALFTLASGFTILQVAINPYAAVLGAPEKASSRLTLTQAFNSLGTTVAPHIGGLFILSGAVLGADTIAAVAQTDREAYKFTEASSVQVPYLVFAGILVVLTLLVSMIALPVIKSVEETSEESSTSKSSSLQGLREALSVQRLRRGALGIFCYVGAEVAIGSFLINFLSQPSIAGLNEQSAARYVSLYWGGAMIGRFVGSALLARTPTGWLLRLYAFIAAGLVAIATVSGGAWAMWSVIAIGLLNSIMFPNIFTLSIDGLGRLTGYGSSILSMAIVGGAVIPLAQGALADVLGVQRSFVLSVLCYSYIAWFAATCRPAASARVIAA
jgi:FHS family L-fucose permease-like MFS transporter